MIKKPIFLFTFVLQNEEIMKTPLYINVNGQLMDLTEPQVMGILNVTPDSFYAGSRTETEKEIIERLQLITNEGASIIDMGAYSSSGGVSDECCERRSSFYVVDIYRCICRCPSRRNPF